MVHRIISLLLLPLLITTQVYDSFSFFNELDMLELRLTELDDVVDYFILIESNLTHSKHPKPWIYEANQARFEKYWPKMIYVQIDGEYLLEQTGESHWDRETFQRDHAMQALQAVDAQPHDLLIISDLDEIPRREVVRRVKACREASFPAVLMMDW